MSSRIEVTYNETVREDRIILRRLYEWSEDMVTLRSGLCSFLNRWDSENEHGHSAKWMGWLSLSPEESHEELSTLDGERRCSWVAHNRKQCLLAARYSDRV